MFPRPCQLIGVFLQSTGKDMCLIIPISMGRNHFGAPTFVRVLVITAYAIESVCMSLRNVLGKLPGGNIQKKVSHVQRVQASPSKIWDTLGTTTRLSSLIIGTTPTCGEIQRLWLLSLNLTVESNFPLSVFKYQLRGWNMSFTWENMYI